MKDTLIITIAWFLLGLVNIGLFLALLKMINNYDKGEEELVVQESTQSVNIVQKTTISTALVIGGPVFTFAIVGMLFLGYR